MKDERDGVSLEISSEGENKSNQVKRKASKGVHKKQVEKRKMTPEEIRAKREEKLRNFELEYEEHYDYEEKSDKSFYIYGLLIAVIISIFSFYTIFAISSNKTSNTGDIQSGGTEESTTYETELIGEYRTITAYITVIDADNKTIDVLNIDNGEVLNIIVASSTKITDQYGRALVFSELELGDGVEINYIKANNIAVTIDKPETFFVKSDKTGVVVNTATNSFAYNDINYFTTDYTIMVNANGEPITLSDIDPADVVTFKGVSNYINYVQVTAGHGTIQFTNIDSVRSPKADINTKTIVDLSKETSLVVAEGDYKVVVTGDNISPYMQYINVTSGETETIDLKMATGKLGNVNIMSNIDGFVLKINEKEYDETRPITLPYGEYTASATKLNYSGDTQIFTVDKPNTNLVFNLVPVATNVILDVTSTPTGASVYVDSQLVGTTPLKTSVSEGKHAVSVKYPNKHDISFDIDGGEQYYKYNFTLVDKPAETTTTETTTP